MAAQTRHINIIGLNFIKLYEGFRSKLYRCAAGYKTIGFGHRLLAHEQYTEISYVEAEKILRKDLLITEKAVIRNINVALSNNQFAALVSFTFNLGGSTLQRSTLRQKINYGLYQEAGEEFLKWIYIGTRSTQSLLKRRIAEHKLFVLGTKHAQ